MINKLSHEDSSMKFRKVCLYVTFTLKSSSSSSSSSPQHKIGKPNEKTAKAYKKTTCDNIIYCTMLGVMYLNDIPNLDNINYGQSI